MRLPNPINALLALILPFTTAQQATTTSSNTTTLPSALPSCAEPALLAAVQASGCQAIDAHCMCSNPRLIPALLSAIGTACDPAAQTAVVAFAQTYCGTSVARVMAGVTRVAVVANTPSSSSAAAGALTVATSSSLPTSISAPESASTPSGALVVDTTALSTSSTLATTTTAHNYTGTMTYSTTSMAKPTSSTHAGASTQQSASSFAAFAIAVGAMGYLFAEL